MHTDKFYHWPGIDGNQDQEIRDLQEHIGTIHIPTGERNADIFKEYKKCLACFYLDQSIIDTHFANISVADGNGKTGSKLVANQIKSKIERKSIPTNFGHANNIRKKAKMPANNDSTLQSKYKGSEALAAFLTTLYDNKDILCFGYRHTYIKDGSARQGYREAYYRMVDGEGLVELRKAHEDYNLNNSQYIVVNPLKDHTTRKAVNIREFKYVHLEIDEGKSYPYNQYRYISWICKTMKLPVKAIVDSAGKSIHAIIKVNATDKVSYDRRANAIYSAFKHLDQNCKQCSSGIRAPGFIRKENGKEQRLLALPYTKDWSTEEWDDFCILMAQRQEKKNDKVNHDYPSLPNFCDQYVPFRKPRYLSRKLYEKLGYSDLIGGTRNPQPVFKATDSVEDLREFVIQSLQHVLEIHKGYYWIYYGGQWRVILKSDKEHVELKRYIFKLFDHLDYTLNQYFNTEKRDYVGIKKKMDSISNTKKIRDFICDGILSMLNNPKTKHESNIKNTRGVAFRDKAISLQQDDNNKYTMEIDDLGPHNFIENSCPLPLPSDIDAANKLALPLLKKMSEVYTIGEDAIPVLLWYIGTVLLRCNITKKCLIIEGEKDTGKTSLHKIVLRMIGDDMAGSAEPKTMGNRFGFVTLIGKAINFNDDVDNNFLYNQLSDFRRCTGGGLIPVEMKGLNEPYKLDMSRVMCYFTLNKLEGIKNFDHSVREAIAMRIVMLKTNSVIKKVIPAFVENISEEELGALCYLSIHTLVEYLNYEGRYEEWFPQECRDYVKEHLDQGNPLLDFIKQHTIFEDDAYLNTTEAYNIYERHYKEGGKPMSKLNFCKHFKDTVLAHFSNRISYRSNNGPRPYKGIRIREDGEEKMDEKILQ